MIFFGLLIKISNPMKANYKSLIIGGDTAGITVVAQLLRKGHSLEVARLIYEENLLLLWQKTPGRPQPLKCRLVLLEHSLPAYA